MVFRILVLASLLLLSGPASAEDHSSTPQKGTESTAKPPSVSERLNYFIQSACGLKRPTKPVPPVPGVPKGGQKVLDGCFVGGCSGQLCLNSGDSDASTCEWLDQYACYGQATCRKIDGTCGWDMTQELKACFSNPPKS